jgi:hypothetical protein
MPITFKPTSKDVVINDVTYQVGQFKARDGSFVLAQLLTKLLPSFLEAAFKKQAGVALPEARTSMLTEEEFAGIQGHALAVCRRVENGVPMPIFFLPNTWAVKEIEYDLVTVMALTLQALVFNIVPFFQGDGLAQILAVLPEIPGLSFSPTAP